ncbi:MAG: Gfo/Idh/MocA family oxidoreductase [Lentisphaerae bacterium]|jgi:predicted dehydrogenase|nr:Gfo/Idh/MocA family oxidoreductase [Lentisphaerota bacterium]
MDCSRRGFIKGAAATLAAVGLTPEAFAVRWFGGKPRTIAPDQKLNVACVGCGGMGNGDVNGVSGENVVALCDVDFGRMQDSIKKHPQAKLYKDYRKMLADMGDQIDAVTVSTPDHMHFPVAMLAMQMGKHVYVQKPCAHTVAEARLMGQAARKYGVCTQMGNQGHANDGVRRTYAWIRGGAIGNVREVHTYTDRPIWDQKKPWPEPAPVPANLDWDLWCGTGPLRPYPKGGMHFRWRGWWDYGCGALGDMACHIMDPAFWALDLRDPMWVEAESDAPDMDTTPLWSKITYFFAASSWRPPVKMIWYDGKIPVPRPPELEEGRNIIGGNGSVFYGSSGGLMTDCYGGSSRIFPEKKMKKVGRPRKEMTPPSVKGGHYQEWIRSCKGDVPAGSNFTDHAGPLTEMVLLGNLAIRANRRIYWDAAKLECIGDPEATALARTAYRVF